MKTIELNLYEFHELSESAKQIALTSFADINVDYDWWDCIYEDAKEVGLKITHFDIGRSWDIGIKIYSNTFAYEVATKIVENYGDICETHKTAANFIRAHDELVKKYSDGIKLNCVSEENEAEFDEAAEELEYEFLKDIGKDYLITLQKEYEYKTSEEAIIEAIEANQYLFTESGKPY